MADVTNEEPTEMRYQEKLNGDLSYELILAVPVTVTPPKRPSPRKNVSAENLMEKMKAAEKRRLSLKAKRLAVVATEISKIEEASKRKKELINNFISKTQEDLERKMKTAIANREMFENDLKSRVREDLEKIKRFIGSLENEATDAVE
ncbi:uncharacterized protein LOC111865848 [Cryptotermes secundus]|uniref:uncharacterized protein LOC111865848 n=1 Tax=Cryptotermes secundus TaxID=105785 RepID=UPI000CD7ADC3|nr:uncharacterized protein LOC111865848 [Cryptotermes secundus]